MREKDDDLAAALALGARTGRWVPLAAAGGEARTGNGSKNDDAAAGTDAPSSSAQAAMVVSAAEEALIRWAVTEALRLRAWGVGARAGSLAFAHTALSATLL